VSDELIIALEGIELWGHCGMTAEERVVGQRLVVDVRLRPQAAHALGSDDLADTVDYGAATAIVEAAVAAGTYKLIERLAAVIADDLLALLPVDEAHVTVRKPAPPVGVPVGAALVEVSRHR
jgi:dihydroneopterin aldolase